jgi:pimeloyl-ACP methyl ester carboxylesterase
MWSCYSLADGWCTAWHAGDRHRASQHHSRGRVTCGRLGVAISMGGGGTLLYTFVQHRVYCAVLSPGALSSALNWYRANTHPRHFGATLPLPPTRLVSVPTLGVWSSADTALLEGQMTASSRYVDPGCWQYVRLEGVGHWMARDAPTQLNRVLLEWLGEQGGRAGGTAGPEGNAQHQQQQPKAPRSRL